MILFLAFLVIPLALVAALPTYWQRQVLIALVLVYLLWAAWKIIAYFLSRRSPQKPKHVCWHDGQNVNDFQVHFIKYMEGAHCQVTWSKIVDPDRVAFAVGQGKKVVVFLCLRSASTIKEWDLARLGNWAKDQNAHSSALIASTSLAKPESFPASNVDFLSYEDLSNKINLGQLFTTSLFARSDG